LIDHYYICDLHCMFVLRHISFTSANYQAPFCCCRHICHLCSRHRDT
jgi:hypothetical protein